MSNRALAERIADDLFGGNNGNKAKAKQLRLYTDFGDDGRYMAGWSEEPMTDRIEDFLDTAGLIPRRTVAEALAALRSKLVGQLDDWEFVDDEFSATIAALGLDAAKEKQ